MKIAITVPYSYRSMVLPSLWTGGRGKRSPIRDSMVELADETKLPSWYDVPTTKVLKLPGLNSMRWMGITPQAL